MNRKRFMYLKNLVFAYFDVEESREKLGDDPENTMLIYELGRLLSNRGDYEESTQAFSKGLVIGPFNAHLYFGRGVVRVNVVRYWEGISDLATAVRIMPEHRSFWYYLVTAKKLHGDYAGSAAAFRRALEASFPEYSYPEVHRLYTVYLLELNDPESARKALCAIPDYCECPKNDYAFRRNAILYNWLIEESEFINMEDLERSTVKQGNRAYLELNTMYYGPYVCAKKNGDEELMNPALRKIMMVAVPKAFGFKKCLPIAIERNIVTAA